MIINHPLLGPRDAAEFTYMGDASLCQRPHFDAAATDGKASQQDLERFHDWLHLRDNPAGTHDELWYHEQGDRAWLIVTRDTLTHEITSVSLACPPSGGSANQQKASPKQHGARRHTGSRGQK